MNLDKITPENLQIKTNRLQLSVMKTEDFNHFRMLQQDPLLMKYIGPILNDSELLEKFKNRIKPFNAPYSEQEGHWVTLNIHLRGNNHFVGSIGLNLCSFENSRFEIGYLALTHYSGNGYITEASKALLDFLFTDVQAKKVVAHCAIDNIASWKVMEKIGLQREGELKSDFFINSTWYDSCAYGLVNSQAI
jgi:RimJ/RimL family protein N-acetyltransferase